jgi:hypothetical protein
MKVIIPLVITAIMCLSFGCKTGDATTDKSQVPVAEQVELLLGGKDVFENPQRVVPVLVDGTDGSGESREGIAGYAYLSKGKLLNSDQIKRLQAVMFNATTYDFNSAKRCMFQPHLGFIFEKSGRQAYALFCFSCNEVSYGREGKRISVEDFDSARAEILKLGREIFPRDRTLASNK